MNLIEHQRQGSCAVLTLNRPSVLNALNDALLDELDQHLERIANDDSRALIITGRGRAFCAGSDLNEREGDPALRIARMHRLILRLAEYPKISVAAINGAAMGGGLEVALGCTFRVSVAQAKLAVPEIRLGLIPVYGATQLLPRLIGRSPALRMMLDGEALDGRTAYSVGLIDHLTDSDDNLLDAACVFAAKYSRYSLPAQQAIRQAVREGNELSLTQGLALEAGLGRRIGTNHDAKEGIQAFVERREPVFKDC
ncbi:enoyl-CoA hydratase/isomerase family protein [Pseudomonas sp. GD03860]|uniref:enoyl-CoA hydratase/isomerase family protein n=1 Tax=Pseudomonas sp. GD03860 TaxID=2975389 RepID=UPI00244935A4|nr:enoyl-CoA hydratase/isomerase family protein [Pseudomonas sp. GD03860]MDH0640243.1 enoyl-CoA hydratase/isomerase family protein [Pseudomonas sp. GD03860]